ncbi:hypothetical protein QTQ03_18580 [Micromonospora sp. WMMA1363]|uniref:hypothetical protein n=1 Tax=Micromonospora sp. WMMA1363 TaxID=3053985 RepID=UPI00259D2FCB|nr:hypothetical protein [Micromonospora sp. WMMA1363]MDM4721500.1 hypothetical protein [Micromonospora sp. WMMA1363]
MSWSSTAAPRVCPAAPSLGRARRSVLVVGAGEPRNAPAVNVGAHGILGREGISPLELLRLGREEVAADGVQVVRARVAEVLRDGDGYGVVTEDGQRVQARQVLLLMLVLT